LLACFYREASGDLTWLATTKRIRIARLFLRDSRNHGIFRDARKSGHTAMGNAIFHSVLAKTCAMSYLSRAPLSLFLLFFFPLFFLSHRNWISRHAIRRGLRYGKLRVSRKMSIKTCAREKTPVRTSNSTEGIKVGFPVNISR